MKLSKNIKTFFHKLNRWNKKQKELARQRQPQLEQKYKKASQEYKKCQQDFIKLITSDIKKYTIILLQN